MTKIVKCLNAIKKAEFFFLQVNQKFIKKVQVPIYIFFAFDGKIQGKFVVLSFKTKENKLVMNLMSMLNILNASLSTVQIIICSQQR